MTMDTSWIVHSHVKGGMHSQPVVKGGYECNETVPAAGHREHMENVSMDSINITSAT